MKTVLHMMQVIEFSFEQALETIMNYDSQVNPMGGKFVFNDKVSVTFGSHMHDDLCMVAWDKDVDMPELEKDPFIEFIEELDFFLVECVETKLVKQILNRLNKQN